MNVDKNENDPQITQITQIIVWGWLLYYRGVKDILIGTTIFVDQAHPLIPDFNLWINLDFIRAYLRSSAVSSVFASIRGSALCSS